MKYTKDQIYNAVDVRIEEMSLYDILESVKADMVKYYLFEASTLAVKELMDEYSEELHDEEKEKK